MRDKKRYEQDTGKTKGTHLELENKILEIFRNQPNTDVGHIFYFMYS